MLRKFAKKKYRIPKDKHSIDAIKRDRHLVEKFAIASKRQIWRATQKLSIWKFRFGKAIERKNTELFDELVQSLQKRGIVDAESTDTFSVFKCLTLPNYFSRTLVYIVSSLLKIPVKTAKLHITHRKVLIGEKVVNLPYLLINKEKEKTISFKGISENIKKPHSEQEEDMNTDNPN